MTHRSDTSVAAVAKPVVRVSACNRGLGQHPLHIAGKKYIDAVLAICRDSQETNGAFGAACSARRAHRQPNR